MYFEILLNHWFAPFGELVRSLQKQVVTHDLGSYDATS